MQLLSAGLLRPTKHAVPVQTMDAAHLQEGGPGTAQIMVDTPLAANSVLECLVNLVCLVVQHLDL